MTTRRQVLFGDFSGRSMADPFRPSGDVRKAVFSEVCLAAQGVFCRSCGEVCAADAIRFRPAAAGISRPLLQDDLCTGCGDCLPLCPSAAIRLLAVAAPPILSDSPAQEHS